MGKKTETKPLEVPFKQPMEVTQVSAEAAASPIASHAREAVARADAVPGDEAAHLAAGYVGQWNRLVSTTNWDKGRIICAWREALLASGQSVTDYSDETWARLVGHVSGQHVGRLRRVYQRFGAACEQYEGLFWSHFQAALDWQDAEMWLEGAIQNGWSVSQMRGQRWETLGTPAEERTEQAALEAAAGEETLDEDAAEPVAQVKQPGGQPADSEQADESPAAVRQADPRGFGGSAPDGEGKHAADPQTQSSAESAIEPAASQRLGVVCEDLPDALAEAFEQFKLAIIAQRREGWRAISREGAIECLDALKGLVWAE